LLPTTLRALRNPASFPSRRFRIAMLWWRVDAFSESQLLPTTLRCGIPHHFPPACSESPWHGGESWAPNCYPQHNIAEWAAAVSRLRDSAMPQTRR
jgi:hypothetical protein